MGRLRTDTTEMFDKEIKHFISRFSDAKETFLHGCCYWFAWILFARFYPEYQVEMLHDPVEGHFLVCICDQYYDIRGDVTDIYAGRKLENLYQLHHEERIRFEHLMRDCRDFLPSDDEEECGG